MTRSAVGWPWRISSLVFVCMIALAMSEDLSTIATAGSGSELLIVSADEDDADGTAELMPACASASVDDTDLRSFVTKPRDFVEPFGIGELSCLRCAPRGPPPSSEAVAGDTALVLAFPRATTPHHTSLELQTAPDFSPNRRSGVDRYPR